MQQNKSQPCNNSADVYKHSLSSLLNGDIKSAVATLNKFGKPTMANHVIACFGNEFSKLKLRQLLTNT